MRKLNAASHSPRVSVVVLTRNRAAILRTCIQSILRQQFGDFEVLVLDDASDDEDTAATIAAEYRDIRIRTFRSERPLGVAGGRNFLMQQCRGEFVVAIDDDARLMHDQCLGQVVEAFERDPAVGAVAFNVTNVLSDRRTENVPFSRAALAKRPDLPLQSALVSYYVGCGHSLRRSVVQQHGGYRADMVYGAEELDLAYRMINAGFSIAYEPRVTVEHHPQPSVVGSSGRRSSEHYYQVRNRIYLAYRYLPWRYAVPYVGSWLARYALRASKEKRLGDMLRGVCSAPSYLRNVRREVVSRNGLAYLTAHGGRLWY